MGGEGSERVADLLRHYLAAGALLPKEKGGQFALDAGLRAMKSGAIGQAIEYFEKGLELADEHVGTDTVAFLNLYVGQLYIRRQDSGEKVGVHLNEACTLFEKTGNRAGLLEMVMMR